MSARLPVLLLLAVSGCNLAAAEGVRPALGVRRTPSSSVTAIQPATAPRKASTLRGGGGALPEIPSSVAMLIGAAGIFFSYSVMAIFQEDVYKKLYGGDKFAFTFFVLVIDRGLNALSALLGIQLLGTSGLKIPLLDIFYSGVSQMFAMATSNEALRYVSYPTQVLGKSCKMVPVMAGGIVLSGKRYSLIEYLQVALITIGVVVFNFGGKKKAGGGDSPYGLFLIALSLLMDMVTGGLQDRIKVSTKNLNPMVAGPKRPSMHESMLWTNASGFLVALLFAIVSGHLVGGIKFCAKHPPMLVAILIYSLASALGGNFVYFTLTQFNPLVLTTVTTTRKIFSTLYSIFRNPANSLDTMQWSGTIMVFAGLLGDIARKMGKSPKPAAPKTVKAAADASSSPAAKVD